MILTISVWYMVVMTLPAFLLVLALNVLLPD